MEKDGIRRFFTDDNGKEYLNEACETHMELAKWIVENDEQLKEEFEKSRMKLEMAFLLKRGWIYGSEFYIYGSGDKPYKEITCLPQYISERGKEVIGQYRVEGYKGYDLGKMYGEEQLKDFLGEIEEQKEQNQKEQEQQEK